MTEIEPGQLWWDKNHKGCDGSKKLDVCYLVLSGDKEDDKFYYRCAFFMWGRDGYMGSHDRKFTEKEMRDLEYVGNISQIKGF